MLLNTTALDCHAAVGATALPAGRDRVCDGILDAVGSTPLVRLSRFLDRADIELNVKVEALNPGGSAKDRPAKLMLQQAITDGIIDARTTVVESSSGNMGIGLAQACAYHGLRFICVVDPRAQPENLAIIRALGGEIDVVRRPSGGTFLTARLQRVRHLSRTLPNAFWPNQYASGSNPLAHYRGTIAEIDGALDGQFDVLFVATSSTGTARGCRDYLRDRGRDVEVVAVDSVNSILFDGSPGPRMIPGLGAGEEPPLACGQSFDRVMKVTDLQCVIGCRLAARREAMLVGGSAGGVLASILKLRKELAGKRCVAILHDSGTRYLQTIFDDAWVELTLGVSRKQLHGLVEDAESFCIDEVLP
ncbi:2,3-diaminopropionate biosynthesis protein SbnA [Roseiconus nitratireducens]|uniref:N-(2-amino-2-carboxyethyl)-L-glutamate synthase n=1 Tax=Roseiconus nitratireducens TaxID=2605748 RepID=A0A5M6CVS6_9BACT|nr:2,3-diaminopropionate biosynthesis protein SbnA [Roseiconus nitratireducens]KAA5539163.1 2,3-diaminopropionate biosynthesis protein SbnA [Roseiconus nitratireducens]